MNNIILFNEYLVSINSLSTIKLTFYGQSNEASIGIWYPNETSWQIKSSICELNEKVYIYIRCKQCKITENFFFRFFIHG